MLDSYCNWGSAPQSESQLAQHPDFLFIQKRPGRERAHATLWFEPQACMKSDLVCARWNNSYGRMIPNSRNTTCWSLPEIGRVSRCASVGQRGLWKPALVIIAPRGSLSDQSSSLHTLFTYWSATPSPLIPIQMDVYLDSGPEQDFIVISVEGDSENITLGFHSAGKLLFSSVNREITSHKHSGGKKGLFLNTRFGRWNQNVHSFWFLQVLMSTTKGQDHWHIHWSYIRLGLNSICLG